MFSLSAVVGLVVAQVALVQMAAAAVEVVQLLKCYLFTFPLAHKLLLLVLAVWVYKLRFRDLGEHQDSVQSLLLPAAGAGHWVRLLVITEATVVVVDRVMLADLVLRMADSLAALAAVRRVTIPVAVEPGLVL